MTTPYTKPHLSYRAQLEQIKARGLIVDDEDSALWHIEKLGYYRLSGYFYPFRVLPPNMGAQPKRESNFVAGTSFTHISKLYKFDQALRLLAMDAVEKLEVALRAKVAYHMGSLDPCAHLNSDLVNQKFCATLAGRVGEARRPSNFATWVQQHDKLIARSREDFIQHFRTTYDPPIPLWVSIEVWDFGLLSHYFAGLRDKDKQLIASELRIPRHVLLASWLRTISHLRNICAHHSRLWNRSMVDSPKPPARNEVPLLEHLSGERNLFLRQHVYGAFAIIQFLLVAMGFDSTWKQAFVTLIEKIPSVEGIATLDAMGFSEFWRDLALWN